jgi:hypothetical protein
MVVQYFSDMDSMYEQACEMEASIEAAIMEEDYESAARLRKQYQDLRRQDVVDEVLQVRLWQSCTLAEGHFSLWC